MLYFVTSSRNKFLEAKEILKMPLKQISLDLPEIQAIEVDDILRSKAKLAYKKIQKPCLVEDTGLYIRALNGFPGALAKWVEKTMGWDKFADLLKDLKDRRAYAKCVVCYYDGKKYRFGKGKVAGSISPKPRGVNNFGWDCIFVPRGFRKTWAEMSATEKNQISHRQKALEGLVKQSIDKT